MQSHRAKLRFATFIASAAGLAVLLAAPAARAQDKTFELKL